MSTDLIINVNPKSIFSEAIKTIRTNLAFSMIDKKRKTILLTSPQAGDGKSFITAYLLTFYLKNMYLRFSLQIIIVIFLFLWTYRKYIIHDFFGKEKRKG